jgi:hypothetical protein
MQRTNRIGSGSVTAAGQSARRPMLLIVTRAPLAWGRMPADSRGSLVLAWWVAASARLVLVLTVLADVLDPRDPGDHMLFYAEAPLERAPWCSRG